MRNELQNIINMLSDSSIPKQYINWLDNNLSCPDTLYINKYKSIVSQNHECNEYAHSVITRTQGKRPEMFKEMLLSLAAQEDSNFELLILAHNVEDECLSSIKQIVYSFPESFASRIRIIQVDEGNRTTLLNIGFAYAKGKYISVLDDDDIVFDHYISSFNNAAKEHFGCLLHAYVLRQRWEVIQDSNNKDCLRAISGYEDLYCKPFDYIAQLYENSCPFMGIAFPAFLFKDLGICFDESLETTEDWDYIMRTAMLMGVFEIPTATAIYRIFSNSNNTRKSIDNSVWERNRKYIQQKFNSYKLILSSFDVFTQNKVEEIHFVPDDRNLISRCKSYYQEFGLKATINKVLCKVKNILTQVF